jgi:hypothetical protein
MSAFANCGHECGHLQQAANFVYGRYAHVVCAMSRDAIESEENNLFSQNGKSKTQKSKDRKKMQKAESKSFREILTWKKRLRKQSRWQSFQPHSTCREIRSTRYRNPG